MSKEMVKRISWKELRESGVLFLINQMLHFFGLAIVLEIDIEQNNEEKITDVYPARVKFRGFTGKCVDEGYKNIQKYLEKNIDDLKGDFDE